MRALIIGSSSSTLPLTKKQRSMAPFAQDETPSFSQGWGAPVAAAILPFANSTFPGRSFSLKIVDRWPISEQTGSLSAQFWVERDASPLTVTLAWTDPASLPSPDSAVSMLVNDIDLLLVSPQGRIYVVYCSSPQLLSRFLFWTRSTIRSRCTSHVSCCRRDLPAKVMYGGVKMHTKIISSEPC
jgi:hypothetical protein